MDTISENSLTFLSCFCESLTEKIKKLQQVIYNSRISEEEQIFFTKRIYGDSYSIEDCIKLVKKSREVDPSLASKDVSKCEQEVKYINELIQIINSTKGEMKNHLDNIRIQIVLSNIEIKDRKYIKTKYNDSVNELYILKILYNKVSQLDDENCRNYINNILLIRENIKIINTIFI